METVEALLKFLSSYPTWAKVLALSGLILSIGTLVLAPRTVPDLKAADTAQPPETPAPSSLKIFGVELFPSNQDAEVQVFAFVNGTQFRYPSVAGVEWLRVGPSMSAQTFKLPEAESYELRFEMKLRVPGEPLAELVSQEMVTVTKAPHSGIYNLHKKLATTRAASVSAAVQYSMEAPQ